MTNRTPIGYNLYLNDHHPLKATLLTPLGLHYVPVTAPAPVPTKIIDPASGRLVTLPAYRLDLTRLTEDQLANLITRLAAAFSAPPADVLQQIIQHGIPVLQRDCKPPTPVYSHLL